MRRETFELHVLVYGRAVREYSHSDGKIYIEGRRGSNFTLRISNNGSKKILAIPTVDGLSVMDGKQGSFDSSGYVLNPFSYVDIPGWRLNNSEIAKFFFSASQDAYAAKMDVPNNIGVIGCAIFEERQPAYTVTPRPFPTPMPRPKPYWWGDHDVLYSNDEGTPKTLGAVRTRGNLGTGFGERAEHRVINVQFEKATPTPICVLEIHYDERSGLDAKGIDLRGIPEVGHPNPFPAEGSGCLPPKDWRG